MYSQKRKRNMGLFDRLNRKKERVDWGDAYHATPKIYEKPDGSLFGAIALTEGTKTVLPHYPESRYQVDGQPVMEWKLVLVSTSNGTVLGDCVYHVALNRLKPYVLDYNQDTILTRELSLAELENIIG